MSHIDDMDIKLYNALTDKITEAHNMLSNEAKKFIASELLEDDIIDYQQALLYYQFVIKDRLYMCPEDEEDFDLIETIKILIQCYLDV